MRRSTAVRLKWKPLTLLCLISIILLITAFKLYSSVENNNTVPAQQQMLDQVFNKEDFDKNTADEEQLVEKLHVAENTKRKKFVNKDEYILWDQPQGQSDPAGPGENGVGVQFAPEENAKVEESYSQYGFNQYVSDQISLHRLLSDPRPKQ